MKLLVLFFLLILVGLGGGYLSTAISKGSTPAWSAMVPSVLSGLLWGLILRQETSLSLSLLAVLYDVIYTAAYVGVFVVMGETMTVTQIVGFIVSLVGIVMMSK